VRVKAQWHPQAVIDRKCEILRHDTYHRVRGVPELQCLSGKHGISPEMLAPQLMTDHNDRRRAGAFVSVREVSAEYWPNASYAKS
jgi:hypothetical protein